MKLKPNQGRDSGFFFIYEMRTNGEDRGNDLLPPRAIDLGFFSFVSVMCSFSFFFFVIFF